MVDHKKPSIYEFLDVVQFLEAYFFFRKQTDPHFTYTRWCHELGFGNKTTLRFLLQRKRKISQKSALAFKVQLQLDHSEEYYFDFLLIYSQPRSKAERLAAGTKLLEIQRSRLKTEIYDADVACRDAWGPIILTLVSFKDFTATENSLANLVPIDRSVLKSILDGYVASDLLSVSQSGVYSKFENIYRIPDKPKSQALKSFHRYWLEQSKNSLELDYGLRRIRSLNFALNEDEFSDFIERINDFAIGILGKYSHEAIEGRRMYMLETALFPVTEKVTIRNAQTEYGSAIIAAATP